MSWGGKREGAGRKIGWRKPEGVRMQRQMKAYDDEWDLIRRFAKIVKHGNKQLAKKMLEIIETEN